MPSPKSTPLVGLDVVVLDLETTSLDAQRARIVEIGAIPVTSGALSMAQAFHQRVQPGIPIPPETTAIHGIADADVAHAPTFGDVFARLETLLDGRLVVGHTINYDMTVLAREAERVKRTWPRTRELDVRLLAEIALPGLAQYDLDRIAAALKIPVEGRHSALGDANTTAQIYLKLLPLLRQRGVRTLGEVERAANDLVDRQISASRSVGPLEPAASRQSRPLQAIDSYPFRHRIADVMSTPVVRLAADAQISEALDLLLSRKVSSAVIADAAGVDGILTERDLLRALHRTGAQALGQPAAPFATRPVMTVSADMHIYRAIGRMERLGIRHFPVADDAGAIIGMVTTRNLLRHRSTATIAMGDRIDSATTRADLGAAWAELARIAKALLDDGVDPLAVSNVISTEICAVTRRAALLAEEHMAQGGFGPPPCAYTVLVLGSAGRGESLMAADQDNALIYATGDADGPEDRWFAQLAAHFCETLDVIGIDYCKGGIMAKNAPWRMSLDRWRQTVGRWLDRSRPEDLLNVDIFFDAVAVHGDDRLAQALLAEAFAGAAMAKRLQVALASTAQTWHSPLSIFGRIKTESDGRVDLKRHGLFPVFAAARVLALRHGISARGTHARLNAVAPLVGMADSDLAHLLDAHRTVVGVMLGQQLVDIDAGRPPTPRVDPKRLDAETVQRLTAALKSVDLAMIHVSEGRL